MPTFCSVVAADAQWKRACYAAHHPSRVCREAAWQLVVDISVTAVRGDRVRERDLLIELAWLTDARWWLEREGLI